MVMCLTLKFDDVLDADMLHESLVKLIKNDHWRKFMIDGQNILISAAESTIYTWAFKNQ